MKISKISLDGYRNIIDSTLDFNKITSIVALNNYGKSNFLKGIDFGIDFIKAPNKIKSRMMRHIGSLPINKETADRDFKFLIEGLCKLNEVNYIVSYEFSFSWIQDKENGSKISREILKIKECSSPYAKFSTIINRNSEKSLYKASGTGRCNTELGINGNELLVNKLMNINELFYKEILTKINNINIDIITFMDIGKAFDSIKIYEDSHVMDLADFDKDEGNNIPQIVYHLKENYKDKYETLINAFTALIPSIEKIEPLCVDFKSRINIEDNIPFEIPEKLYEIRIKEKYNNQDTDIRYLSSGSKRIFSLLTSAIIADETNTSLIAFEELENSIHPYLFQKLIIILTNLVKNCKILITSHSPYVIQYLDLTHIHMGIPTNDGTAIFRKIKNNMEQTILKQSTELETSIGDYLFDLLIEGYSEGSELLSYVEWNNDKKGESKEENRE